jgi:hypothetical protein
MQAPRTSRPSPNSPQFIALTTFAYQAAATRAAERRVTDRRLLGMNAQIANRDAEISALRRSAARNQGATARRIAELDLVIAQEKFAFMDELARRDAEYDRDRSILLLAGEQLLATPEGANALRLYNEGGPGAYQAADRVLAQVEEQRRRARETQSRTELAQDRRVRAALAADAYNKGLTSISTVIARYDDVLAIEPDSAPDLWVVAALSAEVDLARALRYIDHALLLPTEGVNQYLVLIVACQNFSRLGDLQRGANYCRRAEEVAQAHAGGPEAAAWRHRAIAARLDLAYVHYAWNDTAEADRIYLGVVDDVNTIIMRQEIEPQVFFAILRTLNLIGQERYGSSPVTAEKAGLYVQHMRGLSAQADRIPAEYDQYPIVVRLRQDIARDLAKALFYQTHERHYLDEFARLTRLEESTLPHDAGTTLPEEINYEGKVELCEMYMVAHDNVAAASECQAAGTAIESLRSRVNHPADQLKFAMDLARAQHDLGLAQSAVGNRGAAIEAYRAAVIANREVIDHPGLAPTHLAAWREDFLASSANLAYLLLQNGEQTEAHRLLLEALPIARAAANAPNPSPSVQRNLLDILGELAAMGDAAVPWSQVVDQYERLERLGLLTEADRAQRARVVGLAARERARH